MVSEEKRNAKIENLKAQLKKEKQKLLLEKKREKEEKALAMSAAFDVVYKSATPKEKTKISDVIKANLIGKHLDRALQYLENMDAQKATPTTRTKRALKKASETLRDIDAIETTPDKIEA